MIRFALAVSIALCLTPAESYGQNPRFTVTAISATMYQAPSTLSAVIGQSPKGAVWEVHAEAPGWIEVVWPNSAKGVAYLPAATGMKRPMTIDEFVHATPSVAAAAASDSAAAYVADAVAAVSAASTPRPSATDASPLYVAPRHSLGFGGRMAGLTGKIGATGRFWSRAGLGVQLEVLRAARTQTATATRVTALQFAPGVLYALPNLVSDYIWIRPYVAGGPTIHHLTVQRADLEASSLGNKVGAQVFGGGEITFAGLPHFALSADMGYRKMPAEIAAFESRRIRFALSGHWFVR